ncbi:MAG: type II toxin-antitoxin system antitoxin SocA domain-containing protein [Bacteroidota bacterium]
MKQISPTNEMVLKQKAVDRTFRKESFEVIEQYYEQADGQIFTTTAQDELTERQVHNLYRSKHHIPFPEEIKTIRLQYGLSAAKMSEVLDFGANSYRNYEGGEIPSLANAKLIRLAANPRNFLGFVEEKEEIFSTNGYKKVMDHIQKLMPTNKLNRLVEYIWNYHMNPNEFTGFVKPAFEKVANFVLFFAEKAKPRKTRLNKLLFYADFLHFKQTGFAISGCNYRAIPFGPVPSHFHELFGILETEKFIRIEQELFEHGGIGERFLAEKPFDPNLFSESELESMQEVLEKLNSMETKEIIDLSHEENGWKENQETRELISYQTHAFELKGV